MAEPDPPETLPPLIEALVVDPAARESQRLWDEIGALSHRFSGPPSSLDFRIPLVVDPPKLDDYKVQIRSYLTPKMANFGIPYGLGLEDPKPQTIWQRLLLGNHP